VERLEALAEELRARHGALPFVAPANLADSAGARRLLEQVAELGRPVEVLINNAGYGLTGAFAQTRWADQQAFLQLMVVAPCELAHKLLPGMIERRYGRIVNVASVAGLVPGAAGHTLYGPAKCLLIKFSQSLHLEAAADGVHVSALCPGFTYTEFHDVNGTRARTSAATPRWMWLQADRVVEDGWRAVEANRAICVPGLVYKLICGAVRLMPDALALAVMRSQGPRFRTTSPAPSPPGG
ncbi:MAG TPA: SDR family NAD(P)-dependent oxidoreductase, partial [Phenylobacterium sp.]|uniref:SDR family NAD(P)-dependent oxidoreductase n=1 Tax=Phenylobacterium sp. TaxID=1871053 RepID=UPI002B485D42